MARTKHFSISGPGHLRRRLRSAAAPDSEAAPSPTTTPTPKVTAVARKLTRGAPGESSSRKGQQEGATKRPHRFRPGTVALREIRKLQKTWNLLIPFAPFCRLVREITSVFLREVNRWTPEALVCIQEAAESFILALFQDAYLCTLHAKRVTLNLRSFQKWHQAGRHATLVKIGVFTGG